MRTMRASCLVFLLLGGCSYQVNIDPEKYFPCQSDGSCPEGCTCLGEKACVPNQLGQDPASCEWCPEGRANCDGVIGNGCEVDLKTDINNCGECSKPCILPGARALCQNGECIISSCETGFGDCNQDPADGCEANLHRDPKNCGSCGNSCVDPIRKCNPDGDVVIEGQVCINEKCVEQSQKYPCVTSCLDNTCSCISGYCVGGPCGSDYCRPNEICIKPAEGLCGCGRPNEFATCAMDERCCYGICVKMTEGHCLGCDIDCKPNMICLPDGQGDASCGCKEGFADCNGSQFDDGCETDLGKNDNCGGCGVVCPANSSCEMLGVAFDCYCLDGFFDCDDDLKLKESNGCESRLIEDDNCGACGLACGNNSKCSGQNAADAKCICLGHYADCDGDRTTGCEAPLNNDPQNCGHCGNGCVEGAVCRNGACHTEGVACAVAGFCPVGQVCCSGTSGFSECQDPNNAACSEVLLRCDDRGDCQNMTDVCCLSGKQSFCTSAVNCKNEGGYFFCKSSADCLGKQCCVHSLGDVLLSICKDFC